jgi:hypothetical protein
MVPLPFNPERPERLLDILYSKYLFASEKFIQQKLDASALLSASPMPIARKIQRHCKEIHI